MTDRVPLDHLTSDQYDELCDELDRLRADTAACRDQQWPQRLGHAEKTLAHVHALADRWVKAGPPPLGTPLSRWWDKRLAELNTTLDQPAPATPAGPRHDDGPTVTECREADRRWPLQKHGE